MKKIKMYLDNCCFNWPYGDQEQIKIRFETEVKLKILTKIKIGSTGYIMLGIVFVDIKSY